MASLSALDSVDQRVLRGRLEEHGCVERAVIDDETGAIWLIMTGAFDEDEAHDRAIEILAEFGIPAEAVGIEIATAAPSGWRRRVRFESARREELDTGRVRVTVQLEWQNKRFTGTAEGEKGSLIELRTAAQAAVEAIHELTRSQKVELRLIGVKQLRAFDTELVVASLLRSDEGMRRYVGSVLATAEPGRGACLAVLNATNRMLGNVLRTE